MAILTTEAVVLRGWKMGETSKILSLYTRDYGKVRVVAKAGRDPKSKFKGCLESLTHLRVMYYDKPSRDLQLLSKTDLIDAHLRIVGDARRTALGLAVCELIDRSAEGDPHPEIFDLLAKTLRVINDETAFVEGVFWYFESHLIYLLGYKPTWDICMKCGQSLGHEGGYFHSHQGGLLCQKDGKGLGGLYIEPETLEILYFLQNSAIENAGQLKPALSQRAEIRKLFDLYLRTHVEQLKSLRALKLFYSLDES